MRGIRVLMTALALGLFGLIRPAPIAGEPAPTLIAPPFVRSWTFLAGDDASVIGVRDGRVYYRSSAGVGALDRKTGAWLWSINTFSNVVAASLSGPRLWAISRGEKSSALFVVDLTSGPMNPSAKVAATLPEDSRTLATDTRRVYALDNAGALHAFDVMSGAPLWSRTLVAHPPQAFSCRVVPTADGLYVTVATPGLNGPYSEGPDREMGIDASTGRVLWSRSANYAGLYFPLVVDGDVIAQNSGLRRVRVRTGQTLWTSPDGGRGEAVRVADRVVSSDYHSRNLIGRDLATGRIRWRLPLRGNARGYFNTGDEHEAISDNTRVWLAREPVVCIDRDGHEIWVRKEPFSDTPYFADNQLLVTIADDRILGYVHGSLPPLPTAPDARKALAEKLASQFEILDDAERAQLGKLAPFAFRPLLARYVEWAKVKESEQEIDHNSGARYSRLEVLFPLLMATCQKSDTDAVVAAWTALGDRSEWRGELESLLQKKGDPAGYVPVLVARLRALPIKDRGESAALDAVAHSPHPDAVALMLEALRDPRAAPAWRAAAFQHLAGVGGDIGVQTVRDARAKRAARRSWFERADPEENAVSTKTDSAGRTWRLFHSAALGNRSDLFVAQKTAGGWGRPLFLGVWTERTWNLKASAAFHGVPMKTFLASSWIGLVPEDPAIRRDSDGDSVTDLVEARLGSDPHSADTDRDGLSDAVDPCPNAAPRAPGDTEKIIAACVEARFFAEDWETPATLSAGKVAPFELYGYPSTVVWDAGGAAKALTSVYAGGMNTIGFHSASERRDGPMIEFGPDRKTARTLISRYSGGLNGDGIEVTLKKIGDDWFVVDMRMQYVS